MQKLKLYGTAVLLRRQGTDSTILTLLGDCSDTDKRLLRTPDTLIALSQSLKRQR